VAAVLRHAFLVLALWCFAGAAYAAEPASSYREVFYPSGALRIQAYLYRPPGEGPFPVLIYNHGSRETRERR
jgi:poly(3-hydroxybutyrate) depolymerase